MSAGTEQNAFDQFFGSSRRAVRSQGHEGVRRTRLARRNISCRIVQNVETAQLDRLLQTCETLAQLLLHLVAGGPRLVEQLS